jgi:hypothetical protein
MEAFLRIVDSRMMVKGYSAIAEWFCYPPLQSVIFIAIDISESVSPLSTAKCLNFLVNLYEAVSPQQVQHCRTIIGEGSGLFCVRNHETTFLKEVEESLSLLR